METERESTVGGVAYRGRSHLDCGGGVSGNRDGAATRRHTRRRADKRGPRPLSIVRDGGWSSIDDLGSSETQGSLTEGAIVRAVTLGSHAADVGLEDGDIVVGFDVERVRSARQLSQLVEETPVGREVPLLVMRDNERLMPSVTPGEGADSFIAIRE